MFTGHKKFWAVVAVTLLISSILAGCVTQAYSLGEAQLAAEKAAAAKELAGSDQLVDLAAQEEEPTVSFKLSTALEGGRLVFKGTGDLEGQTNPDLVVEAGDVVEIILANGDGVAHNLAIEELGLTSGTVFIAGQETKLVFKAEKEGIFPYFCAISGHRQSGMEGRLIVNQPGGTHLTASNPQHSASQDTAGLAETGQATVSFTLKTGMADGRMAFIGVGGDLEGQVNPDLIVNPGDVVEIVLVNGDAVLHNIAIEGFDLQSEDVTQMNEETKLVFTAGEEGIFPYFCAVPGHRQAGMEGRLIVGQAEEPEVVDLPSIARSPVDLPAPLTRTGPEHVRVDLETTEVQARLADGTSYTFWTFNGLVPGPFIRVRTGDTVEVHLKNSTGSTMAHSVDFHAVTGPGGGAVATQTQPGQETTFTFKALNPGLYVYHCATPMVAHHIANGMYGLILVEPEGGLPPVDREFYVMQGEIYTAEPFNQKGEATFSQEKLLDEDPEYFILNGGVGALTQEHPLKAQVGETVRIFFGVGGPNYTSSFHVIGEIFDRVYDQASLTAPPLTDVQTTIVPTGGAVMVEFELQVPGRYILVDHSLSRMERGLAGFLEVEGEEAPEIFHGTPTEGSGH